MNAVYFPFIKKDIKHALHTVKLDPGRNEYKVHIISAYQTTYFKVSDLRKYRESIGSIDIGQMQKNMGKDQILNNSQPHFFTILQLEM